MLCYITSIHRTPYDRSAVSGQLFHCFFQMGIATVYFVFYTCQVTIFLGFSFYIEAFCDDFMRIFDELDDFLAFGIRENGKNHTILLGILKNAFKSKLMIIW